ncbi:MAG: hypothetical protein LBH25_14945, partial [Fibromonadaceae bacterium]|nr:hypothetical protein [Fibromonadaceae bacterium]
RNKNDTTEFISKYYTINITRTLYGAHAKYNEEEEIQFNGEVYDVRNEQPKSVNVKLSMEEWLDFIRALSTCCLDKWESKVAYSYSSSSSHKGVLYAYFSSKGKPSGGRYEFPIKNTKQPNLNEFEKVIEDMIAKMRNH